MTHSLHLRLHHIVYGNRMLQFDANANVDASVNEVLQHVIIFNLNLFKIKHGR